MNVLEYICFSLIITIKENFSESNYLKLRTVGYNQLIIKVVLERNLNMTDPNGCVLIPAFNEEKHIGLVIELAKAFLPVIVIDDGSSDQTISVANSAGAFVFKQMPNQGKGAALQRGFLEVIRRDYDFAITIDADGQHDANEIKLFLDCFQNKKTDLIIGYRDFSRMPFIRRIANSFGGYAFSWAMGQTIRDNQSGFRLMSKRLLEVVLESVEHGFEFEVEVIVKCIESGFELDWVPIRTIYADETSHIKPLHHIINFTRVVLQTRKRMNKSSLN